MEMMCFDGKGLLVPTQGQRLAGNEKMPNNRLRPDINQISPETIERTHIIVCSVAVPQNLSHQVRDFKCLWNTSDYNNAIVIRMESIQDLKYSRHSSK